jgi:hypothetical protein
MLQRRLVDHSMPDFGVIVGVKSSERRRRRLAAGKAWIVLYRSWIVEQPAARDITLILCKHAIAA